MSADPAFGSVPRVASNVLGTFDASLTAPSNVATILTGVAAGTQVEEIIVLGLATTVAEVVNIFLYDGSVYHLYDQMLITAVTSSTTAAAFRQVNRYGDLFLPSTSWSLRATHTITTNDSKLNLTATGWDFT